MRRQTKEIVGNNKILHDYFLLPDSGSEEYYLIRIVQCVKKWRRRAKRLAKK